MCGGTNPTLFSLDKMYDFHFSVLSTSVLLGASSSFFCLEKVVHEAHLATVIFTAKTDTRSRWLWRCYQGLPTHLAVWKLSGTFHCNLSFLTRLPAEDGGCERLVKLTAFDHLLNAWQKNKSADTFICWPEVMVWHGSVIEPVSAIFHRLCLQGTAPSEKIMPHTVCTNALYFLSQRNSCHQKLIYMELRSIWELLETNSSCNTSKTDNLSELNNNLRQLEGAVCFFIPFSGNCASSWNEMCRVTKLAFGANAKETKFIHDFCRTKRLLPDIHKVVLEGQCVGVSKRWGKAKQRENMRLWSGRTILLGLLALADVGWWRSRLSDTPGGHEGTGSRRAGGTGRQAEEVRRAQGGVRRASRRSHLAPYRAPSDSLHPASPANAPPDHSFFQGDSVVSSCHWAALVNCLLKVRVVNFYVSPEKFADNSLMDACLGMVSPWTATSSMI